MLTDVSVSGRFILGDCRWEFSGLVTMDCSFGDFSGRIFDEYGAAFVDGFIDFPNFTMTLIVSYIKDWHHADVPAISFCEIYSTPYKQRIGLIEFISTNQSIFTFDARSSK